MQNKNVWNTRRERYDKVNPLVRQSLLEYVSMLACSSSSKCFANACRKPIGALYISPSCLTFTRIYDKEEDQGRVFLLRTTGIVHVVF